MNAVEVKLSVGINPSRAGWYRHGDGNSVFIGRYIDGTYWVGEIMRGISCAHYELVN